MMCRISTMSGWRSRRRSLISRRMRVASETWSKTLVIFLIATRSPVSENWSTAAATTPYEPLPMTSVSL